MKTWPQRATNDKKMTLYNSLRRYLFKNMAFWVFTCKTKMQLSLDNFSLRFQQLVPNYFLYPCKCPDFHLGEILSQFCPDFASINISPLTTRHFLGLQYADLGNIFWRGGYDEKGWKIACNWLMMMSSHCPNLVKIVCNCNFCHAFKDFYNINVTKP